MWTRTLEMDGKSPLVFVMHFWIIDVIAHSLNLRHRYNDHHFHYGYHIYAAAIVAKHRPEWARKYNDRILLYIRDIANPSAEDKNFPMFRQKDWYLGNSWAGGLMSSKLLRVPLVFFLYIL